jgi:transcriptional regulator with XRE-family HTH domain
MVDDASVGSVQRSVDRGQRRSQQLLMHLAEEIAESRRTAGLSQDVVSAAARMSRPVYGRIERGERRNASVNELARIAAVLGHELSVRMYPVGDPIRDAGQQRIVAELLALCRPPLVARAEVPLPRRMDRVELRAWDIEIRSAADGSLERRAGGSVAAAGDGFVVRRAVVEVEMRLRDIQALERRLALKSRDDPADVFVLVIARTRGNRRVLAAHPECWPELPRLRRHALARALSGGEMPSSGVVLW